MIEDDAWGDLPRVYSTKEAAEAALLDHVNKDRDRWVWPEYRDLLPPPDLGAIYASEEIVFSLTPAIFVE